MEFREFLAEEVALARTLRECHLISYNEIEFMTSWIHETFGVTPRQALRLARAAGFTARLAPYRDPFFGRAIKADYWLIIRL